MVTDEVTCIGCDGDDALCNCDQHVNLPCPEDTGERIHQGLANGYVFEREQWCN